MGDRVAVLRDGVLQQCAAPRELYRNPVNVFVAEFIGSPPMNLFTLPVIDCSVSLGEWSIPVPREVTDIGGEIVVGIRPEHFEVGVPGVEMEVEVVEELGADTYLYGHLTSSDSATGQPVTARADVRDPPQRGCRLPLRARPDHIHFFGTDGRRVH